jgi:YD repeat-containing protein
VIDIQRQSDANGKLINSSETRTDASGNKIYQSQTTVDSNGNRSVRTIEQQGTNKVYTDMQYNADGTINAKQTTYDANGNKVSETTDADKIVGLNN